MLTYFTKILRQPSSGVLVKYSQNLQENFCCRVLLQSCAVAGLKANFIKDSTTAGFMMNFQKIFKTAFLKKPFWMAASKRSSCLVVFYKIGVLRNFTKYKGKHLCQSFLFFNKVGGRPANLIKKGLWHRCSPMNFGGCFCFYNFNLAIQKY